MRGKPYGKTPNSEKNRKHVVVYNTTSWYRIKMWTKYPIYNNPWRENLCTTSWKLDLQKIKNFHFFIQPSTLINVLMG